MELKCLVTCKIGNDTYKAGEIYDLPELIAKQQLQSSEYFKSVNKLYRVFFEKVVNDTVIQLSENIVIDTNIDPDNDL